MTNFCNLKCKYCFANEGTYNKTECFFSGELIDELIDFLIQYPSVEYITFFGGEPLLNLEGIRMICEKARKVRDKMKFYCQTNGTIMNDELKSLIREYDIKFTLSVDGEKEDNDRNRIYKNGAGSFEKIVGNYAYYKDNTQSIEATYDGESKKSKNEVSKYLTKTFGCRNISVIDLFGESRQIKFTNPKKDIKEIIDNEYIPISRTRELIIGFFTKVNQCFFCSAGTQLINIDSDGKIYPCHLLIDKGNKYLLGNLNNFDSISFESKRQEFIRLLDKNSYSKCRGCFMSWNCAQCFAAKESFSFKDCSLMKKNGLEIFEEIATEIIDGHLLMILKKFEGTVKYV
ncbi:radical SAM/SPASM domain-containing protein [Breznakia pachnodae]|nr:radical SAM protein [Breznakia pachnodae]